MRSHVPRTLSIVTRPNRLDIKFNFINNMVTDKDSERKAFTYEGNGCRAIELALVRDVLVKYVKA